MCLRLLILPYNYACIAIQCQESISLVNGIISYDPESPPYVIGTVATYNCNAGYFLNGTLLRNCTNDEPNERGVWSTSGSEPLCEGEIHTYLFNCV